MKNLEALFNISYGLYIISSKDKNGKYNGFVGNAVTQVNSEPPTFAVVVNKNNLTHNFIKESGLLSISILSINTPLSFIGQFGFKSGREIDKFQNVNYKISECGVPVVIDHTIAYIVCKVFEEVDRGSHTIFLTDLLECEILKEEEPMTYLYYRKIKRGTTSKNAPTYINKSTTIQKEKNMQKYICKICNYIYDPAIGDPDGGISPGTPFEKIPDSWVCPVCGASKDDFEKYEG